MNTRKTLAMLAALATIPLAAMAVAQQAGPQGGPPRGGFGQGDGPGGPRMMQGGQGGGARILMRPEVQRELRLTEDQIGKIREIVGQGGGPGGRGQGGPGGGRGQGGPPPQGGQGQGFGGGQGGPPPGQNGPPPGGFGGGQGGPPRGQGGPGGPPPMDQQRGAEIDGKLKTVLHEGQFKRYKELSLQEQGPAALSRKDVADKVGLSEEQRQQIRAILEAGRPQMPRPQEGQQPPDFEAMRKQMDAAREQNGKKILAVLSSEQRQTWNDMLGQPFKFEKPQGQPGGPGGRGGRGGGQGGPPPAIGGGGGGL